MLSLTIQLPLTNAASHCITVPWWGISITSPGTRSSDGMSTYTGNYQKCERQLFAPNLVIMRFRSVRQKHLWS